MSGKFCYILVIASLRCVYNVTEAVQDEVGTYWLYRGSWCAGTLCIAWLHVGFERWTGEYETESNKIKLWSREAIETNPASSIRRVSGDLGLSQSSVVRHVLSKSIQNCRIVLPVLLEYCKIFDSPKYFWFIKLLKHSTVNYKSL